MTYIFPFCRFQQLAGKERQSRNKLMKVSEEKISPVSSKVDGISNTNEVMKSVYKTDYGKKGKWKKKTNKNRKKIEPERKIDAIFYDNFMHYCYLLQVILLKLSVVEYSPSITETDSLIGRSVIPATANWKDAYRDPFKFRYSAMETPTIQPAKTISLLKGKYKLSKCVKNFHLYAYQ